MKVINLTPHAVVIQHDSDTSTTFPPSGVVARVWTEEVYLGYVNGVGDIVATLQGEVELPESEEGIFLLVSSMVAAAATDREDLLVPHDLVRDDEGRVVGAKALRTPRPSVKMVEDAIANLEACAVQASYEDDAYSVFSFGSRVRELQALITP